MFYKSKTKEWIDLNYNKLDYTISHIIDKNNIFKENYNVCGIYCWKIDNIPYYIGQSTEIYNRSLDHIFTINTFPKWWLNIIDNLDLHQLKLSILIKCDKKDLNYYEEYFINQLKPLSQYIENKTFKYDYIIPLKLRDFNLNNLKEKYYKIGGNINDIK